MTQEGNYASAGEREGGSRGVSPGPLAPAAYTSTGHPPVMPEPTTTKGGTTWPALPGQDSSSPTPAWPSGHRHPERGRRGAQPVPNPWERRTAPPRPHGHLGTSGPGPVHYGPSEGRGGAEIATLSSRLS